MLSILPRLFIVLLISMCGFALFKGGRDERLVALTCVVGTIATHFVLSPLRDRYAAVESGVVVVDVVVLACFIVVALISDRFWPLWVAGLQLTTVAGHFFKAWQTDASPIVYGATLQFWSYPILVILGIGTWRRARRVMFEGPQ